MTRAATRDELLTLISSRLADVEDAIHQHPDETVSLYEEGRRALLAGQERAEETDWSRGIGLSLEDLALVHHYLFSTAFISAWHDVRKDKTRRDQATSPACLLVSGLGFSPEDVLHRYMQYEKAWRTAMKPRRKWFG
jgi:hypothetical protein